MADWSMLPDDVLSIIAFKLASIEDFVYFSAVCRPWNRVFAMVKLDWSRANNPITPWLLLGESNNNDGRRKIFSIGRNKCYQLTLPETFGARCWGTLHGFILLQHLDKKIELYNPITKAKLNLPSLRTMPIDPEDEIHQYKDHYNDEYWRKHSVRRFIVLKIPQSDEFVVMAIHWRFDVLAYARPGDQIWTSIHTSSSSSFQVIDVCFWDRVLLILYQDGTLASCDITQSNNKPLTAKIYMSPSPIPRDHFRNVLMGSGEMYMVVLDCHLHLVSRLKEDIEDDDDRSSYHTYGFLVHKLDAEKKLWEKVEDFGDFSLFVGTNPSMVANKSTNCQRNVIYFTDDENNFWGVKTTRFRGHDMGVYDMTSRSFGKFYQGDDALCENSSPTWFIPNF